MDPNKARVFIAVELNDSVRQRLEEIQSELKKIDTDIKWVNPRIIHLTLKFLGDVPQNDLDKVCAAIEDSLRSFSRFEFQINNLGCFPTKGSPKIIWAGVDAGSDLLKQIAETLSAHVSAFCEEKDDKEFSAHITLGRLRSSKNVVHLIDLIKNTPPKFSETQNVDHITLFKSDLTPSGPNYSIIKTFNLM